MNQRKAKGFSIIEVIVAFGVILVLVSVHFAASNQVRR